MPGIIPAAVEVDGGNLVLVVIVAAIALIGIVPIVRLATLG